MARVSLAKFLVVAVAFVLIVSTFHYLVKQSAPAALRDPKLPPTSAPNAAALDPLDPHGNLLDFSEAKALDLLKGVLKEGDKSGNTEKSGKEKTGKDTERTGNGKTGNEKTGTEKTGNGKTGTEKTGTDMNLAVEAEPYHYTNGADFYMSQLVGADGKVKAAFVSLVRNRELYDIIKAIRSVEDRFNHKFKYDWVFFNDEDFSKEFIDLTTSIISGKTKYGKIPKEHWGYPEWIDQNKAAELRKKLKEQGVIYGDSESYRHMCRFELGFFWQSDLMKEYEWYWRVEPGVEIHCDVDYDVFKYMQDNKKVYGLVITIYEYDKTIPTLWEETHKYMDAHPDVVAKDNAMRFLSNDQGKTYNLCHFWSNFEVANLNFWRSKAYRDYFEHLDKAGGFFYERWGDAPVHSIAASLFLSKDKIHFFQNVGYSHNPYTMCPIDDAFRLKHRCTCNPDLDFTFRGYSCGKLYHDVFNIERPKNWSKFT